jgi:hypothetical protein
MEMKKPICKGTGKGRGFGDPHETTTASINCGCSLYYTNKGKRSAGGGLGKGQKLSVNQPISGDQYSSGKMSLSLILSFVITISSLFNVK